MCVWVRAKSLVTISNDMLFCQPALRLTYFSPVDPLTLTTQRQS
jgi:hypothetical protein